MWSGCQEGFGICKLPKFPKRPETDPDASVNVFGNCKAKNTIALMFEGGPNKEYMPLILAVLKAKNAKASFFINGLNDGDLHDSVSKELTPVFARLPRSEYTEEILKSMATWGYRVVEATFDPKDYDHDSDEDFVERMDEVYSKESLPRMGSLILLFIISLLKVMRIGYANSWTGTRISLDTSLSLLVNASVFLKRSGTITNGHICKNTTGSLCASPLTLISGFNAMDENIGCV
ncbi:hypothetical protein BASA61_004549 [Batrachochytrium salamandrivorans]|nr:hypothetical protein BASA61_004549 [Batrachochytrium salamandrivorans]